MRRARESRPAGNQAAENILRGTGSSISAEADKIATALVTGVHVVVVETPAGKYRRRVYLSLDSAQRAADRAIMSGHPAHVVLCQLMPVTGGAS
jgi:hypothetical protein